MQTTRHFVTTSLGALPLTACVFLSLTSNAYGMQICQMTDTLVWELEKGLAIDPPNFTEDVVVDDSVLYYWETIEGGKEVLAPVIFDEYGKAEHNTDPDENSLWFKVSETEFRLWDRKRGTAWHLEITCPDEG